MKRILVLGASALLAGSLATAAGGTAYAANTVTVTNPGTQTTNPLSKAISLQIKATDSAKSTLTYTATGLPKGLAISKTTGLISGTITASNTYAVKVTVTDATKATGSVSFSWVAKNTITVASPGNQATAVGDPVSLAVYAADDDKATPLTWSATGLPAGLAISAAGGIITGAPTKPGTSTVTVKVSDGTGSASSVTFAWKVADLILVTAPATERSIVTVPITPVTVTATDSTKGEPITFTAAKLPPGLAISAAGTISGTPVGKAGSYAVTVTAKDGAGATGSGVIGWTVLNLVKVTVPATTQTWVGVPVSLQVKATDSDPAQKLAYSAAGLPKGLSVNPATGVITGTPQQVSGSTVTVTATDGGQSAGTATFRLLAGQAITIPSIGRIPTNAGLSVIVPVSYSDAAPGDHVTLQAHGLPHGMTFNAATRTIFGWAPTPGTYPVTIVAKGSIGTSRSMTFPLVVKPATGAGPAGQIHLDLGGKCLQAAGNKTANGTKVVLWTCQSGSAQHWVVASDGTIRANGKCLDVNGSGGYLGQGVRLWDCVGGSARETWVTGTAGELVNAATDLCLADATASTRNGTSPTLAACHVTRSQVWILPPARVMSSRPAKCIDDLHSSGVDGNVIDMYSCNGTNSQNWIFEPDFTLRIFSGKCLTDHAKLGTAGAKIELWNCTPGDKGQKVVVVHTGVLSSELTIGGVCIAVPSMTAGDTARLVTAACSATNPLVHWHIW
jgi:hypothetical protein